MFLHRSLDKLAKPLVRMRVDASSLVFFLLESYSRGMSLLWGQAVLLRLRAAEARILGRFAAEKTGGNATRADNRLVIERIQGRSQHRKPASVIL